MTVGRAVVAGGAGFLGSHLCEQLLIRGYEVLCLDNFLTGRRSNMSGLAEIGPFHFVRCDVTEYMQVNGRVDLVLHLASPASPADYLRFPVETLKAGSLGTLRTLDLARERNARYVLTSTSEVYGDPQVHPQREDYWGHVNPVGPRSVYDEAKRFAEALTFAYRNSHGMSTAVARVFNTFGPRMRLDDGRAIPTFVRKALAGAPLPVTGDGLQTRSLCYVDDTVEGIIRLAEHDAPGPVNIGGPRETSIRDLAYLVIELTGSESVVEFVPRPTDDPAVRRPDIGLARSLLGWEPIVDVTHGLKRTIAWFEGAFREADPA
ncbi:UDP-glucuronic acid decarboxylase family protein [Spirillospora sp. NPDC048911]|uniref:UDP-glucuronic acid decarboxylase family protein n=1 Tax=Spirillospora sp. NPDC048911 TaxID=3364527 RepID=UPI00371949B6